MENEKKENNKIKKADIILFLVVIIVALFAIIMINRFTPQGYKVEVRIDGNIVKEMPLDKDAEYICDSDKGINIIFVKDGEVWVKEADCPDKICVQYKPICKVGQVIICLPHKLVIEVVK